LDVSASDGSLVISAEEKETGDRWRGQVSDRGPSRDRPTTPDCGCPQFSSRYIEEITHKTGNHKKFSIFVQMLMSSLTAESDSVFIDLLTYADLELLKSRKMGKPGPASSASKSNNKRYLIMTYAVEYDRVHYPLPLSYEETPDPSNLKMTIARLRQEVGRPLAMSWLSGLNGALAAVIGREERSRGRCCC